MLVRDVMQREVAVIGPDASLARAARIMRDRDVGCLPVIENGQLIGIAVHLARHKVKVEVQSVETDGMEIGGAILSFACDRGGDLLVMGAYAHSRVRELILGGATRTIPKSMTVPVLTAH